MTWEDLELIHVISYMLNLNLTKFHFGGGTANIVTWHFGHHRSIQGAHVVLLYNGSAHFTGTGNNLKKKLEEKCNTFYTVYHPTLLLNINFNQTLSNNLKLSQTFINHIIKHF